MAPYVTKCEHGTSAFARLRNRNFPRYGRALGAFCWLAPQTLPDDISHRVFTALRNLIAFFRLTCIMTDEDERELHAELARLQQEHRDLDAAIDALHQSPAPDLLRLQRMKKRKLLLRDRIAFIEDQITPDIIA